MSASGVGLKVQLVASFTFPAGITISQFSDDADSIDIPSRQIGDATVGVNGDPISWKRATIIPFTINVIPGSTDDENLNILAIANTAGLGVMPINDKITVTVMYPDGTTGVYTDGIITDVMSGKSLAGTGRLKTRAYIFKFGKYVGN
jgi:hypothetical protein